MKECRKLIITNVRVAGGITVQWGIVCLSSGVGVSVEIADARREGVGDAGGVSWRFFSTQRGLGKE